MGWSAARKLRRNVDGLTRVLAVEILTAARAIDMRGGEPGVGTKAVIDVLRRTVDGPGPDRFLAPDIQHTVDLVVSGDIVRAAADAAGELG